MSQSKRSSAERKTWFGSVRVRVRVRVRGRVRVRVRVRVRFNFVLALVLRSVQLQSAHIGQPPPEALPSMSLVALYQVRLGVGLEP